MNISVTMAISNQISLATLLFILLFIFDSPNLVFVRGEQEQQMKILLVHVRRNEWMRKIHVDDQSRGVQWNGSRWVKPISLEPDKGNCSYLITIETSCTMDAGTSNHISLRFGDSKTNDVLIHPLNRRCVKWVDKLGQSILDDVPRTPFQPCSVDVFQVDGPCVDTPICYLYLKLTGSDDWRPGFAQVRVLDEARFDSGYFYFRRYLPRHVWHGYDLCDREVTPFGIKYERKVFN